MANKTKLKRKQVERQSKRLIQVEMQNQLPSFEAQCALKRIIARDENNLPRKS